MTDELYTPYTGLTDERYTWAYELKYSFWHEPYVLQQYRINRDSNLWRSTREVEKLCEYILFLEGAKPMSESMKTICDNCEKDLSLSDKYPEFTLRLTENMMSLAPDAIPDPESVPELDEIKNFCNLHCLKQWSNKE